MRKTIEIPEGYEARIESNKVILEPKESEDERIRKSLVNYINAHGDAGDFTKKEFIAWLEKQGSPKMSAEVLREGIAHYGITQYQIDNWLKSFKERIQPNQSLHPRYIEGKGIYIPVIDVVLNMQDEPEKLTWDRAKDIALSKEQMFVVLYYKDEINDLLEQHGGQKLEGWHWTSTHFSSAMFAWGISFDDSRVRDDSCNYFYKVRAFSAYHSES